MTPPIAQLLALQAMDQYIWRKERDLLALDRQAVNLAEQRGFMACKIQERQQALTEWERIRRQRERELAQVEERSSEKRLRLQQSGGGEEFSALQQEIEELEQSKTRLQEEIPTLREQVEKEKEELQRAQDEKAALRVQVATETAQLRVQMAALHEEIQQKQRERERLAAGIDTPVLQEYERIFAWREGVAVVELYAQTCQGCHMRLPLQMCYEIQANPGLSSCPHCHRLLYWPSSEPSAIGPTPEALETNTQSKQRAARKAGKKAQARKGPRKDLPDNQQVHL